MKTNINDIKEIKKQKDYTILHSLSKRKLTEYIYNRNYKPKKRVQAIDIYYYKYDTEVLSILNDYITQYLVSRLHDTEKILQYISLHSIVPIQYKIEIAKTLISVNIKFLPLFKRVIDYGFSQSKKSYTNLLDAIYYFAKYANKTSTNCIIKWLKKIVNNSKLSDTFCYTIILKLQHHIANYDSIQYKLAFSFFKSKQHSIRIRIICSQLLFKLKQLTNKDQMCMYTTLKSFILDKKLSVDVRMDAVDVLLQFGNKKMNEFARKMVVSIGYNGSFEKTIYNHSQNVHQRSIEKSVVKILKQLKQYNSDRKTLSQQRPSIKHVYNDINNCMTKNNISKSDKILVQVALNRILIDQGIYGELGMSLQGILLDIWIYITHHTYRLELEKRLVEELIEMSGKCSSGYASRLVNTLSGFGDFAIQISYEDQIAAYVMNTFNNIIKNIKDISLKEKIMIEMMTSDLSKKKHLLKIFRDNLPKIQQTLYNKFKHDLTNTDFQLYFKKAILRYEQ